MKAFLYRWLPIVFGCHCRPERSFRYKGEPFPICARCTGELIGMIAAIASYGLYHPPLWILLLLAVPMLIDGFTQRLTAYESRNVRRLWTGTLFGYAFAALIIMSFVYVYHLGQKAGSVWF